MLSCMRCASTRETTPIMLVDTDTDLNDVVHYDGDDANGDGDDGDDTKSSSDDCRCCGGGSRT